MSVVIKGFDKPASCFGCPFNRSDCWCSITNGEIDRDDYSCDKSCPIEPLDAVLDDMKAEFISLYPKNYMGDPELGGASCVFSLDKVLEIIDKYKESEGEK